MLLLDPFEVHSMANVTNGLREKRIQNPTRIFSPSVASMPAITHHLIYISNTASYSIAGRASVKKIQGKMATLVLNKTTFNGEIVLSGKYFSWFRKRWKPLLSL
jgi:hypothetical protein